jgi:hypothetical protein
MNNVTFYTEHAGEEKFMLHSLLSFVALPEIFSMSLLCGCIEGHGDRTSG